MKGREGESIPGGPSQLLSCPSECADRVCLRHSGAGVVLPDEDGAGAASPVAHTFSPSV